LRNTSRRTKLIGGALLSAAIAATSIATVSPVKADLTDFGPAYIRVKPVNGISAGTSPEDQPVPSAVPGATAQAAADVQLLIPSVWEAGDRIYLQVRADGSVGGAPIHQTNCLDAASTISFNGTATATVTGGPWAAGTAWGAGDGPGTGQGTDGAVTPDPRLPEVLPADRQTVTPTFLVDMVNDGTSCAGQPAVKNLIRLTFSNSAAPTQPDGFTINNTNMFEITVANIKYDVGANVNPGPVHVVPFAQAADDTNPSVYLDAPGLFPGNLFSNPSAAPMFTDNAFVRSVSLGFTGGNIIADNTVQTLGNMTITELVGAGLPNGVHEFTFPATMTLSNPLPTVTVTGNGATATGTPTIVGPNVLRITLANMAATAGVVTVTGINASTGTAGPVTVAYTTSPGNPLDLLVPDDQTFGNPANPTSDVNQHVLTVTPLSAVALGDRIGGNDRYETSAKIAGNLTSCTENAVLVSGTSPWDALSAAYLAGTLAYNWGMDVPVLLVGDTVPTSVSAYMNTAGVKNVYIVGGTSAVSAAVQATLENTAATKCLFDMTIGPTAPVPNQKLHVHRVSGADRYATNRNAVNLASTIIAGDVRDIVQLEFLQPGKHTAIVATGTSYADALAAGPVAYDGLPLILTDGTTLSPSAAGAITDNDITQVIIIGGTSAVSAGVETAIQALGVATGRISGADRYATATAWADFVSKPGPVASVAGAFDGGLGWSFAGGVLLASGVNFADALAAAPLAWSWDVPILLTNPTTLSAATQAYLVAHKTALDWVVVLGLGSAVSTSVMNAAQAAVA